MATPSLKSPLNLPRGSSSDSPRFLSPRSTQNDVALRNSVNKQWLATLDLIEKREKCVLPIPYSQGLLFGVLLFKHAKIQGMIADRSNTFTILFSNSLAKMKDLSKQSIHEATNKTPREESPQEKVSSPDYLKKFLDVSQKMLYQYTKKKKKERDFTVSASANGYDREFFKTALFYHYPSYIESIKLNQSGINIHLKENVSTSKLIEEVTKLQELVKIVKRCSTFCFTTSSYNIDSLKLQPKSSFEQSSSLSVDEKINIAVKQITKHCIKELQGSIPESKSDHWKEIWNHLDSSITHGLNHPDLQLRIQELVSLKCEDEKINIAVKQITKHCIEELQGSRPESKSDHWKEIWNHLESSITHGLNHSDLQLRIQELVSLKCELEKASFDLPKHFHHFHDEAINKLSKVAQRDMINEKEIIRTFYPDSVLYPGNKILVNEKELPFIVPEKWSQEAVLSYFRLLLKAFLDAQGVCNDKETVEQLLSTLFLSQIKEILHPFPTQNFFITAMLKSVTLNFEANIWWRLRDFFPPEQNYKIGKIQEQLRTFEFFIDKSSGNGKAILTVSYALFKNDKNKGIFTTKLISEYYRNNKTWEFKIEVPCFDPSDTCSLIEQEEIHKRLLLGRRKNFAL